MAKLQSDEDNGSLQEGRSPILIISNDLANKHSPVVTIVPLTSKLRKNPLPTHVLIEGCGTLKKALFWQSRL